MAAIAAKRRVLEMPGEFGASRARCQATFLNLIPEMRPHVISDLWNTALLEFEVLILRHFSTQISEDLGLTLDDYVVHKYEESLKNKSACPDVLVSLIQQRLAPTATCYDPVKQSLRFFSSLRSRDARLVRERIYRWSKRWNLDADWCRDHALGCLREWLRHDSLRWLPIFPNSKERLQGTGWSLATTDIEIRGLSSPVLAEAEMFGIGNNPEPLIFRSKKDWPDPPFQTTWHATKETQTEFEKRARVEFRLALNKIETARLKPLAADDNTRNAFNTKQFDKELSWRNGILDEFEGRLQQYVRHMNDVCETARREHGLVNGPPPPEGDVLRWLVGYQVPQANRKCCSHGDIATEFKVNKDTVKKKLRVARNMLGLQNRNERLNAGRPRGSGKPIVHRVTA